MLLGPINGATMFMPSGHRIDFSAERGLIIFGPAEDKDGARRVLHSVFICPVMAVAFQIMDEVVKPSKSPSSGTEEW